MAPKKRKILVEASGNNVAEEDFNDFCFFVDRVNPIRQDLTLKSSLEMMLGYCEINTDSHNSHLHTALLKLGETLLEHGVKNVEQFRLLLSDTDESLLKKRGLGKKEIEMLRSINKEHLDPLFEKSRPRRKVFFSLGRTVLIRDFQKRVSAESTQAQNVEQEEMYF